MTSASEMGASVGGDKDFPHGDFGEATVTGAGVIQGQDAGLSTIVESILKINMILPSHNRWNGKHIDRQ